MAEMEKSVKFFQVKMIRKGTKPPVWRRAFVPAGITFTQLAAILETMLEMPYSDRYEFEFFQRKDRLIEWQEEDNGIHDYYFRYLNAPDTFVNERLLEEKRFTFRIRNAHDLPQYRVEIEKAMDTIALTKDGITEEVNSPMLLKESSFSNESVWTDGRKINAELKERYFLCQKEADYLYLSEVRNQLDKGEGIGCCKQVKDRDIHSCRSGQDVLNDVAEKITKEFEPLLNTRIREYLEYSEKNHNERFGEIRTEDDERKLGELVKQMEKELGDIQRQARRRVLSEFPQRQQDDLSRSPTVEENLRELTVTSLKEMAEDIGCPLKGKRKNAMAYELAHFLLEPDTMRALFLNMDEKQLDAWEHVMGKACYLPEEEEYELLEPFLNLNYIAEYMDDRIEMPEESRIVYGILQKTGYREFHEEARWLLICLRAFSQIHVVAPEKILYRMFRRKSGIKTTYKEFEGLLEKLPDRQNPCVVRNGKVIVREIVKNDLYRRIEERQREVDWYIPTETEILTYGTHPYPDCEKAYVQFWNFLHDQMKVPEEGCDMFCAEAFQTVTTGGYLSDYMELFDEDQLIFDSDEQVEEFARLFMNLNNSTRMFELRGHTPLESRALMGNSMGGRMPTIVPMSSEAAKILSEGSDQIKKAGLSLDLDSGADEIPMIGFPNGVGGQPVHAVKKVYPNDPCPCGSGKKYKKCCGRKQ